MWRVGHADAPLDYTPYEFCSWQHRFDDPMREYRTIYGSEHKLTALREVLADLRPNVKARADFAQFQLAQGVPVEALRVPGRAVTAAWRRSHQLAPARVEHEGELVDIDDPALREKLATRHARLLAEHGMTQLNISEIRSKIRVVSQTIARDLYMRGAAGIWFRSNLDDGPCIALMEGRARFAADGEPLPLTEPLPELGRVCEEYNLALDS
ncbi:RES family NAD+ phosphorylase [Solirubrobacter deserti]|uniref:RES family NAD+ phosphorylase n=1 Tax=Solirubrobacter deserti TaxID=2282478 RepID=A0ABT4RP96_9ACTN|nr:RES family NAD+ phosphorylase [Solirubrobacter deserti]MDA0140315.1 RES family NAD+ phosphorylase [Solirubrobacter deserti]